VLAREFAAFADGVGHFAGLAQTDAHAAALVTDHHECAEIKTASAFDHFRGTVNEHDFFDEFLRGRSIAAGFRRIFSGTRIAAPTAKAAPATWSTGTATAIATATCSRYISHSIYWLN
jgi:hypothetical protein